MEDDFSDCDEYPEEDDDYYDDDDEGDEYGEALEQPQSVPTNVILTPEEITQKQQELKRTVSEFLGMDAEQAQILLIHFRWNKDALFAPYMDNPDETARRAGVLLSPPEVPSETEFICEICFCDYPVSEGVRLQCEHIYCKECVKELLATAVTQGPACITTTCPHVGCPCAYTESHFRELLPAASFQFYLRHLVHSFIDGSPEYKWCPAPGCRFAVQHTGSGACRCRCGHYFCFHCSEEVHHPATCDMVERWLIKCNDESEDLTWITANTKQCPKCKWAIQKNQGCNHMTCSLCKHEFCWMCLGPWSEHGSSTGGYYKCNKYDPNKHDNPYAQAAQESLTYYVHYFERYNNHHLSMKFADKQRKAAEAKVEDMQGTAGYDRQRSSFILQAVEQLLECRRVLKWTYVFGFYLRNGAEKNLFEFLQQNLERNTEHLSELTERPIENIDRMELINYTQATKKFLHNLIEGVENGLRN